MFQSVENNRIKFIFLMVVVMFIVIIIRIFYIQVIEYKKLNTLAESLWSRNLPVQADRGNILDRNGKIIAGNETTSTLILIPVQIKDKELVAKSLAEILEVDYEEMYRHVSKQTSIERVHPEGRNLSYEVAEKINNLGYDGVYLLKETKRYYKYDTALAHVIGYVGIDNQGLSGLELLYDKYLTGIDGSIKYFSDGKGNKLEMPEVYVSPTPGMDLTLTIDLDLQLALENELTKAEKQTNAEGAIGIVMNPNTGEILAMSSRPTFNPSKYQNYSIETINRNLAIWSSFEPGSTFKILTITAAINEGLVNVFEEKYYDTGKINVSGTTIHCWKPEGHGEETYVQVVENSCNPGFVVLGNRLGKEKLFHYIDLLGFGKKTGIDLNGEGEGIIFDLDKVGPLELATTAFGQGVAVTAMQQVNELSTIINGGTMYTPFVVKSISEKDTGIIIEEHKPIIQKENVIKKETSDLVKYILESVVANGGGHNAYIEGYRVGGKTGTAQKVGPDGRYMFDNYVLSFIGFLPADDPEVVVYIAVDGAKNVTQFASTVAAPIAREVLKNAISVLDIESDPEGMPKSYVWYDTKYLTVPDVVGLSKNEAIKALSGFRIEYVGEGETVASISPDEGTRVKEGGTIKLLLN